MAKTERSKYQKRVVAGYYKNLNNIMLQRLGELVTELYLAETDARRDQLWKRVREAMKKLRVKPAIIDHIMQKKDPQILAKNLADWLSK